jgi:thiamine-phosphate diphosphorylase
MTPSVRRAFRVFLAHGVLVFSVRNEDPVSLRLQVIIDRYRPLEDLESLVESGVDCLQVRIQDDSTRNLVSFVRDVVDLAHHRDALVHVNRRLDVAMASGADGVQLPLHGIRPSEARAIAPQLTFGCSVHSVDEAVLAAGDGADFVLFGHVFDSDSHPGQPGRGLDALVDVVRSAGIPVIAIGGIGPENAASVAATGAIGIAVIGSVWTAIDRNQAIIRLRKELNK